jgi:hypothetical protein
MQKISCPCWELNRGHPACCLLLYWLSYPREHEVPSAITWTWAGMTNWTNRMARTRIQEKVRMNIRQMSIRTGEWWWGTCSNWRRGREAGGEWNAKRIKETKKDLISSINFGWSCSNSYITGRVFYSATSSHGNLHYRTTTSSQFQLFGSSVLWLVKSSLLKRNNNSAQMKLTLQVIQDK